MDIKERFNVLKEKKEKINKAKMEHEVRLEALKTQMKEALSELYTTYNVSSIQEAKEKYKEQELKLVKELEQMEQQLAVYENTVNDMEI